MSVSTEYEAPDTLGKAAKAVESYQDETDDLVGERMVLNMGRPIPLPMECSASYLSSMEK